jgi:hypothetical protein
MKNDNEYAEYDALVDARKKGARDQRRHELMLAALSNPAVTTPMLQFKSVEVLCAFTGTMRTGDDAKDMMRANVKLITLQVEAVANALLDSGE